MTKEYGLRIFLKDGEYEDFDPLDENEYGFREGRFFVDNGNLWEWEEGEVIDTVRYEITQEKAENGSYIRIFDDESAIRMVSDLTPLTARDEK